MAKIIFKNIKERNSNHRLVKAPQYSRPAERPKNKRIRTDRL